VVTGSYYRTGGAVEMLAKVSDARTGELTRAVGPVRAHLPGGHPWAGDWLERELSRGVVATLDSLARAATDSAAVRALPLVAVPARADGDALVVLITGDGNWAESDRMLADELAARGVPVVGLKARTYLAPGRTPEETAADVARILRAYGARWGRSRVALVGYSRGADAVPFVATRLPADLRGRLALVAMLGPGLHANFHFHWMDLVRDTGRPDDLPTRPEIERLAGTGTPLLCVYGREERESACRGAPAGAMRVVARPGGHHFDRDFRALGDIIADALAR